ncbi:MAG: hypothetical protein COA97_01470 [Flavobacteriales bacterium]|nr:MAG: hypothetical protein COA97_01470 [Flavobacteriales bacterium]
MKKILLLPALLLLISNISFAQLSFKTGSVELDKDMATINADAKLNIKGFTIDLSVSHSIPIPKIKELLKIMEPAEIILAKNISIIINKPMDDVVASYKINKDKGWGQIAKEMGIKPGSPEFHALKGKTKEKGNSNSKSKGKGKKKGKKKGKGKK